MCVRRCGDRIARLPSRSRHRVFSLSTFPLSARLGLGRLFSTSSRFSLSFFYSIHFLFFWASGDMIVSLPFLLFCWLRSAAPATRYSTDTTRGRRFAGCCILHTHPVLRGLIWLVQLPRDGMEEREAGPPTRRSQLAANGKRVCRICPTYRASGGFPLPLVRGAWLCAPNFFCLSFNTFCDFL